MVFWKVEYGWEKEYVNIETQTPWGATSFMKGLETKSYSTQITWKDYHIQERFDLFCETPKGRSRPSV